MRGIGGLLGSRPSCRPPVAVFRSGGEGPVRPASNTGSSWTSGNSAPGQDATGSMASPKLFSVRVDASAPQTTVRLSPHGPLLEGGGPALRPPARPTDGNAFLAYYTRHRILPGRDRLFFFNVIAGADVGDTRPYEAWVRLMGPAELVSVRRLDLSGWHLGLPLSFVFDERGISAESTFVGGHEPATDGLPDPRGRRGVPAKPAWLPRPRPAAAATSAASPPSDVSEHG